MHIYFQKYLISNVNKSKSGSGTKRTIRKAMDYINNLKLEELNNHLFFFEFTPGIRDDVYFNDEKTLGYNEWTL